MDFRSTQLLGAAENSTVMKLLKTLKKLPVKQISVLTLCLCVFGACSGIDQIKRTLHTSFNVHGKSDNDCCYYILYDYVD